MEDLGCRCLPAFERFLQVIERPGNLVGEVFALFAVNNMLVICKRQFAAAAQALPQKHGRDMFNSSGASHTFFDGVI